MNSPVNRTLNSFNIYFKFSPLSSLSKLNLTMASVAFLIFASLAYIVKSHFFSPKKLSYLNLSQVNKATLVNQVKLLAPKIEEKPYAIHSLFVEAIKEKRTLQQNDKYNECENLLLPIFLLRCIRGNFGFREGDQPNQIKVLNDHADFLVKNEKLLDQGNFLIEKKQGIKQHVSPIFFILDLLISNPYSTFEIKKLQRVCKILLQNQTIKALTSEKSALKMQLENMEEALNQMVVDPEVGKKFPGSTLEQVVVPQPLQKMLVKHHSTFDQITSLLACVKSMGKQNFQKKFKKGFIERIGSLFSFNTKQCKGSLYFEKLEKNLLTITYKMIEEQQLPLIDLGIDTPELILYLCEKMGEKITSLNLRSIELNEALMGQICTLCPRLETLDLSNTNIPPGTLTALKSLKFLRNLYLPYCKNLTENSLDFLKKEFSHLESLNIQHVRIDYDYLKPYTINQRISAEKIVAFLETHPRSGSVRVSQWWVEDPHLADSFHYFPLPKYQKMGKALTYLNISYNTLSLEDASDISEHCPNVQVLNFRNCKNVDDTTFQPFMTLKSLEVLNFTKCNISDQTLNELINKSKLKYLNISGCKNITTQGLKNFLSNHPQLKHLLIGNSLINITEALSPLKNSCLLEEIAICHTLDNDEIFGILKNHPKLRWVALKIGEQITTKAFNDFLEDHPLLEELVILVSGNLSDEAFKGLKNLRLLKILSLSKSKITTSPFEFLAQRPSFIFLHLTFCPMIHDEQIEKILPKNNFLIYPLGLK